MSDEIASVLVSFGRGCELGDGLGGDIAAPKQVESIEGAAIVDISCGGKHILCLSKKGEVFAYGWNWDGQLGLGDTVDRLVPTPLKSFALLKLLRRKSMLQVVAGGEHSIALDNSGLVYSWGSGKQGQLGNGSLSTALDAVSHHLTPKPVLPLHGVRVVQIASGSNHVLALSDEGVVYSWGAGKNGRLGHGSQKNIARPRRVSTLQNRALAVACGWSHSMAIAAPRKGAFGLFKSKKDIPNTSVLYTWGRGDDGRLGTGAKGDVYKPKSITEDLPNDIVAVAGGHYHSAVLDNAGYLYMFGNNSYGQCGLGPYAPIEILKPKRLPKLKQELIGVSCGGFHTLAWTEDGLLYAWGLHANGQLGVGDDSDLSSMSATQHESFDSTVVQLTAQNVDDTADYSDELLLDDDVSIDNDNDDDSNSDDNNDGHNDDNDTVVTVTTTVTTTTVTTTVAEPLESTAYIAPASAWASLLRGGEQSIEDAGDVLGQVTKIATPKREPVTKTVTKTTTKSIHASAVPRHRPRSSTAALPSLANSDTPVLATHSHLHRSRRRTNTASTPSAVEALARLTNSNDDARWASRPALLTNSRGAELKRKHTCVPTLVERYTLTLNDGLNHELNADQVIVKRAAAGWWSSLAIVEQRQERHNDNIVSHEDKQTVTITVDDDDNDVFDDSDSLDDRAAEAERLAHAPPGTPARRRVLKATTPESETSEWEVDSVLNSSSASGIVQQSDATSDVNDEDDDYEHFATIAALASQGAAALAAAPPEPSHLPAGVSALPDVRRAARSSAPSPQLPPRAWRDEEQSAVLWQSTILPDWDHWCLLPKTRTLWRKGVPSIARGDVWKRVIGNQLQLTRAMYNDLVRESKAARMRLAQTPNSPQRVKSDLMRRNSDGLSASRLIAVDLPRTMPQLGVFKRGVLRAELQQILEAYARYNTRTHYAQGMSYVAGMIHLHMRSPYETFVCLANLLDRDIFQALYSMSIGDIGRHVTLFESLLSRTCPALAKHFKQEAVSTDYYLLDWYMTMFARTLNFAAASRIWDCVLLEGEAFLCRAAVGVLKSIEKELISQPFEQCVALVRSLPSQIEEKKLMQCIFSVDINEEFETNIDIINNEYEHKRASSAVPSRRQVLLDVVRDDYMASSVSPNRPSMKAKQPLSNDNNVTDESADNESNVARKLNL